MLNNDVNLIADNLVYSLWFTSNIAYVIVLFGAANLHIKEIKDYNQKL